LATVLHHDCRPVMRQAIRDIIIVIGHGIGRPATAAGANRSSIEMRRTDVSIFAP
jgi:hypothetical protein